MYEKFSVGIEITMTYLGQKVEESIFCKHREWKDHVLHQTLCLIS